MKDMMKIGDELNKIFDGLVKITPEDFQRIYGKTIDKTILDEEKASGREYIGGEFIFECVDDKNFTCGYSLYFQDEQENFFKKEAKSGKLSMSPLLQEMRDELMTEKIIKFEIPEPSDEARELYEREHSETK